MKVMKIIGTICYILGGVTFLIGLAVLLGTYFIGRGLTGTSAGKDFYKKGNAVETTGIVTSSVGKSTRVTYTRVDYYVDSEDDYYHYTVDYQSSALPSGKEVAVFYNPDNPSECVIPAMDKVSNTALALSCILSGIGVGFVVVLYFVAGTVLFIIRKKKMAAAQ